jgi:iron complex outermembrane receptor protein
MIRKRRSVAAPSIAAVFAFAFAAAAHAQQQAAPAAASAATQEGGVEEIVVSAQKRTESLQNVPFSVAAPTEAQIRNAGADSLAELARNVAGLTIADLGPGQSQIAIRGISSGQVIRDQPGVKEQVGVYLDESAISVALFTPDLVFYDMDRFEVLRGPQGTLYGSGSEAGTLRYITKQPKLGVTEGNVELTGDIAAGSDIGGGGAGMMNIPLGPKVALRAVAYYDRTPGWIDAIQPGGNINANVNTETRDGGRLALLWRATDNLTIEPRYVFQNLWGGGYPRVDLYNILANPYTTTQPAITIGDRQQYTQLNEGPNDEFQLSDVKIDYDFGPMKLTSVSSYTHRDLTMLKDETSLSGSVTFDLSPGPSGQSATPADVRLNSPLYDRTSLSVLSEEMRLSGSGVVDWVGGLFWQHIGRHYGQDLPTPGYDAMSIRLGYPPSTAQDAPPDTPFYSDLHYSMRQWAVFGEATWHALSQWDLTAGLRYYDFAESRTQMFGGLFGCCSSSQGAVDSTGVSPRAILSYKLDPDVTINAQASRGFRLGGINDPLNVPLCSPTDLAVFGGQKNWKDETDWNYELGTKMRLYDRKVTFNASVFYTDIKDLQATTTAGTCSSRIVFNVPTARSTGLEAELQAKPNSNWNFSVSGSWIDAKLTSSVTSTDNTGNTVVVGGLQDGNRLPTAPKLQLKADMEYTKPLPSGHDLFGIFTLQYVGSSFSQFEQEQAGFGQICTPGVCSGAAARLIQFGGPLTVNQIAFPTELPSYTLGNLRVGLRGDRWEVAGFIDNLWDESARLALDYERGRSARVSYITNMPRLVGVNARFDF